MYPGFTLRGRGRIGIKHGNALCNSSELSKSGSCSDGCPNYGAILTWWNWASFFNHLKNRWNQWPPTWQDDVPWWKFSGADCIHTLFRFLIFAILNLWLGGNLKFWTIIVRTHGRCSRTFDVMVHPGTRISSFLCNQTTTEHWSTVDTGRLTAYPPKQSILGTWVGMAHSNAYGSSNGMAKIIG